MALAGLDALLAWRYTARRSGAFWRARWWIAPWATLSGPLVDTVARESTRLLFALGGFLFVLWTIGYFAAFWSATGETPGNRLLRIRVRQ
jgi:RDD family protein